MSSFQAIDMLKQQLQRQVIGQSALVDRLIIALLANGHLLVEGAPGLAKTRAIRALADCLHASFQRVQFTPDLLPADLTGTDVYRPEQGIFEFLPGPLFHQLVLADEINRAPAKVQSALLEAMSERSVSMGNKTYPLPEPFLVMATQNPIEHEGTYALPEAQLDRFLMHVLVSYPSVDDERTILQLVRRELQSDLDKDHDSAVQNCIDLKAVAEARREVLSLYMADTVEEYIVRLVHETRTPRNYDQQRLAEWIEMGASPRATLALDQCARAHAWLHRRDYVSPADVHAVAHDVLRHRLLLKYAAVAEGLTPERVVTALLQSVAVP